MNVIPTPKPPTGTVRIEKPVTHNQRVVWVLLAHHFTEVEAVACLAANPGYRRATVTESAESSV